MWEGRGWSRITNGDILSLPLQAGDIDGRNFSKYPQKSYTRIRLLFQHIRLRDISYSNMLENRSVVISGSYSEVEPLNSNWKKVVMNFFL